MKTKITILSGAVLLGISSMASAADPVPVPSIYNNGPASPILNMTNMRDAEKNAFALSEAMLQATESLIHVKGCTEFSRPVTVYSYPAGNDNFLEDTSFGGIKLTANPQAEISGFGQHIDISQVVSAVLNGVPVENIRGRYTFNSRKNMMVNEKTAIQVKGQNRTMDQYYSTVIKDFYHGNTYDSNGDVYVIYDYGLQSLSKFGYPVAKWWQKSKAVRDDGQEACTVFQKDQLVGNNGSCRITLATTGVSQPDLYWQTGTLKVSKVLPNKSETELNNCSVNPIFELPPQ